MNKYLVSIFAVLFFFFGYGFSNYRDAGLREVNQPSNLKLLKLSFKKNNITVQQGWTNNKIGDHYFMWICFIDSTQIYGITDSIVVSTDGGSNWNDYSFYGYPGRNSFYKASQNTWYVGVRNDILKTTDKGKTWNPYSIHTLDGKLANVSSIYFFSENIGWAVLGRYVEKTGNGGTIWQIVDSMTTGLTAIKFITPSKGFIFGQDGYVFMTLDGGSSWNQTKLATLNSIYSFTFADSLLGVGVGQEGTIVRTTDGGNNWEVKNWPTTNPLKSVFFISKEIGWIVGWRGLILKTTDGGSTWTQQESNTSDDLNDVFFSSPAKGWIVGEHGTILSTTTGGVSTDVEQQSIIPTRFSLSQNYPNPFNPTSTIAFSLPQASNVSLKVFDALGREIAILVNEFKSEGSYRVLFNGSSLSSGVYFYRLQAGRYVDTKKLILMK